MKNFPQNFQRENFEKFSPEFSAEKFLKFFKIFSEKILKIFFKIFSGKILKNFPQNFWADFHLFSKFHVSPYVKIKWSKLGKIASKSI